MHDLATSCGAWLMRRIDSSVTGNGTNGDQAQAPYSSVSPGVLVERGSTGALKA